MVEQLRNSPQNGEEVQNEQENCIGNIPRAENEVSVPAVIKSQSSFLKGDVVSTGRQESVSAVTVSNASGNTVSLDSTIAASTGPPSSIIQQIDTESEIINLDSMQESERESDTSDLNGIIAKRDDDKTSWLNTDSSSTSQGSQGSYARQVPALLGSYGSNGQPNDNLLPFQLPFPKDAMVEENESSSDLQNLEKPQTSNLSDILGPKGMPLGPGGEPLESDLDDILGPQSDGKPSDLDDTLGPYEGSTIGQSGVPPSAKNTAETQAPLSQSTSELSKILRDDGSDLEKEIAQVQSQNIPTTWSISKDTFGTRDSLETKSTIESKGNVFSETSRSALGFTSESSFGDTIGLETSQDDTLHNQSSMWDSSQNNAVSPKTEHTFSSFALRSAQDVFSSSQRDSFSPQNQSIQSGTSASSLEDLSIPTNPFSDAASRSHILPLTTEESTQHSPTKYSQFSPTEHTAGAVRGSPTKHSRYSRTDHTSNAICSIDEYRDLDCTEGGPMWREAKLQAANSKDKPLSPSAKKFAESIMARTRSRADTDALLNNASTAEATEQPIRSMINVNAQDEGRFIESTAVAKKRGRAVQLLTIGLVSFLVAFLGGILVSSSCFFVSAVIQGGDDGEEYELHFGLWKYSPVDSASRGYNYCTNYDNGAPWFGRLYSLIALIGGAYSLGVLWLYLLLGQCAKQTWNSAVYVAAASGFLQLSTLSIFFISICKEQDCSLGPAGMISVVAGCFYFVLAHEMYYNTPLVDLRDPHHDVTNFEMTGFENGAKAFLQRTIFGDSNPHHAQSNSAETKGQEGASYVPPIV